MAEVTISVDAEVVYAELVKIVTSAFVRAPGVAAASLRNLLAAEILDLPAMLAAMGHKKFIDLLSAAEDRELVKITRVGDSRHPYVSPWNTEDLDIKGGNPSNSRSDTYRVRGALWPALVDWDASYKRMWDRQANRAFMFPVVEDEVAWRADPGRFVEVEPISSDVQFTWMREYVATLPQHENILLKDTIGDSAPRGAFRKTLTKLHRDREWAEVLQERVAEYAREWGNKHGIALTSMLEARKAIAERTTAVTLAAAISPGAQIRGRTPSTNLVESIDPTVALRTKLHLIIDNMSLAELSALSVPAAYLIQT
jgi:hypothetical protein